MKEILFLLTLCLLTISTAFGQQLRGKASYYADRFHGRPTSTGEAYDKDAFTAASKELPVGTIVRVRNVANEKVTQVRINDCGPHSGGRIIDLSKAAALQIDLLRAGIAVVELEILSMGTEGPTCNRSEYTASKSGGSTTSAQKPETGSAAASSTAPTSNTAPAQSARLKPVLGTGARANTVQDPNASLPTGSDTVFTLWAVQVAAYGKVANADEFINKQIASLGYLFKRTDERLTRVFVGPFLSEQEATAKAAELKAEKKIQGIVRQVQ